MLYRFNQLNKSNRAIRVAVLDCLDDIEALRHAYSMCEEFAVEVWQGDRRVCRIEEGCQPPPPKEVLAA